VSAQQPPVHQRLYTPGPVNISPNVRLAAGLDVNHRSGEFRKHFLHAATMASCLYPDADRTVLLPGSATYGLEAAISGFCPVGSRVLAATNGVYGDRMIAIAEQRGLEVDVVRSPLGTPLDFDDLSRRAERAEYKAILAAHHETSTGMLNDLEALAGVARNSGRRLIVDVVSSIGSEDMEPLRASQWVAIGSSNKAIESIPGIALVTAARNSWTDLVDSGSFSLDLRRHLNAQRDGDVLFTPPVGAVLALEVALLELSRETVLGRGARYWQELSSYISGLSGWGFRPIYPLEQNSSSIVLLEVPATTSSLSLRDSLARMGLVTYHGVTEQNDDQIRLSSMGFHDSDHVELLLEAIAGFLRE
jgi:2-aminoethylphosphonate-pyruvate transaminase